ncbi:MAG: MotA/TolQ/ExbB proton channel family protein [bacterium]
MTNEAFNVKEILIRGWPVLSALGIMSIIATAVFFDRLIVFMRTKVDAEAFVDALLKLLDEKGRDEAIVHCVEVGHPVGAVCVEALRNAGNREAMEKAVHNATQRELNKLETLVPLLATVASTAPFVGLLGTVVGIIRAFHDIAAATGGGPEVVAAGISEALVATAMGLFVAIPATMAYNYFVHRIQRIARETDVAVFRLIEKLK